MSVTKAELKTAVFAIIDGADLTTTTRKMIRKDAEKRLGVPDGFLDADEYKDDVRDFIAQAMEKVEKKKSSSKKSKKDDDSDSGKKTKKKSKKESDVSEGSEDEKKPSRKERTQLAAKKGSRKEAATTKVMKARPEIKKKKANKFSAGNSKGTTPLKDKAAEILRNNVYAVGLGTLWSKAIKNMSEDEAIEELHEICKKYKIPSTHLSQKDAKTLKEKISTQREVSELDQTVIMPSARRARSAVNYAAMTKIEGLSDSEEEHEEEDGEEDGDDAGSGGESDGSAGKRKKGSSEADASPAKRGKIKGGEDDDDEVEEPQSGASDSEDSGKDPEDEDAAIEGKKGRRRKEADSDQESEVDYAASDED